MKSLHRLWITATYICVCISGEIIINPSIDGYLGEPTALECQYYGSHRWILLQWQKRRPGETVYTPFINLLQTASEPEWAMVADFGIRERIRPYIRRKERRIFFNLMLNLDCYDEGDYRCQITGLNVQENAETSITIRAFPLTPHIMPDINVIEINNSVTLECSGNVGLPAAQLQWFFKTEKDPLFLLVDGQVNQNYLHSDDCRYVASKQLTIVVTPESNGNVYRCAAESSLVSSSDPRYYDDITVRLPKQHSKDITTDATMEVVMCLGSGCSAKYTESTSNMAISYTSTIRIYEMIAYIAWLTGIL